MGAFDHLKGSGDLPVADNPFVDQPGMPPPALTGRDGQLRQLLAIITQLQRGETGGTLFLPGPRGLGKTSLLVETAREAAERSIAVVRTELARDGEEAASLLVASLGEAVGRSGITALARRVSGVTVGPLGVELAPKAGANPAALSGLLLEAARATAADGGGLLVLIDEAQEHPQTAAAVVRAAHRGAQDGLPIGAVLAGLPRSVADVVAEVSYAERVPVAPLLRLEAADALAALARPLADRGVHLPDSRIDHVFTVTGGYPFFVQVLGRELWIAADSRDEITTAAWNAAVRRTTERTERWLSDRFARVPASQQRYLLAASVVGWPAGTGDVAEQLDAEHASLSPARAALIDDGLLYSPARGLVDLVIPPLGGWLDRHRARGDA